MELKTSNEKYDISNQENTKGVSFQNSNLPSIDDRNQWLIDTCKNKDFIIDFIQKGHLAKILLPSFTIFTAFLIKSKWVKKTIVKRHILQPKNFNLQRNTALGFIPRNNIFSVWDKSVENEFNPQDFILVEGAQGTGKTHIVKKYVEEKSKTRPAIYISLRGIQPDNWQQIISKQIHLYPEFLQFKGGKINLQNILYIII